MVFEKENELLRGNAATITKWICKQCRNIQETTNENKPDHTHAWERVATLERDPVLLREVVKKFDVTLDNFKKCDQASLRG